MIINGHEFKFAYTVGAYIAIQNSDIKKLATSVERTVKMALIMSKQYEDKQTLLNQNYKIRYLTEKELEAMTLDEIEALDQELWAAMQEGNKRVIETVQKKTGDSNQ